MANTALNRSLVALLTNKSGGALTYGAVVIFDNTNASSFTTTTTSALSTRQVGVIIEPNGIANNATGLVCFGGYCPQVTLNTASTVGQFLKTHTVAGQATPHSSPQVEGDFGVALTASATPAAILFGSPNGPTSAGGTPAGSSGDLQYNNGGSFGGITPAAGVSTFLQTPTSANLKAALTDETGSGAAVFATSPALTTPDLGTPSALTLTNATGLPTAGIVNSAVTLAKIANAAANSKLLGSGASGSGAAYAELTLGTNLSMSGTTLNAAGGSGKVAQIVNTQTGTAATGTTTIPFDNTIPQNTEGTEFITLAITPTSSTNTLLIDVLVQASSSVGNYWIIAALFQDTTANALCASPVFVETSTAWSPNRFKYYMTAGTTSATTFKVRIGTHAAGTVTFNGQAGGGIFGGVLLSSITITEFVP